MSQNTSTKKLREVAILVSIITQEQNETKVQEYLDELEFLADTAGVDCDKRFVQRLSKPVPATFVGKGKLEEIALYVEEKEIDLAIFDDALSPSQIRNIEEVIKIKVVERTSLILDIFAKRAKSAEAKAQVELAQYEYLLPRLKGLWSHLERQRGGIGMRGPGEKELETDRRIIQEKISKLKTDLIKIDQQRTMQRQNRAGMVRVSLVGYTNVGKSTLMNLLSKSDVFVENRLFATLDTTTRKIVIDNIAFLLSDTVGFIRKLPHQLVESFKSTLDEVRDCDILLHVVDISHPQFEEQLETVKRTLDEIGVDEKPVYLVFNKIDAFTYVPKDDDDLTPKLRENYSLDELKNSWIAKSNHPCIFLSAKEKTNLLPFKMQLYEHVKQIHKKRYPYDNYLY